MRKKSGGQRAPRHEQLNATLLSKQKNSGKHRDKRSKRGKDKKVDLSDLNLIKTKE